LKKKFVTNLLLIILLNLLIKPVWIFGIDRTVQNLVGVDEFGMYTILLNISLILNMILDLGITNFNNRNISQNHQLLQKHFSSLVILKIVLALVYGLVVVVVGLLNTKTPREFNLLLLLAFNQLLISFTLYLRSNIAGMQMHTANSLISVLDRALMVLFCAFLLWGNISGSRMNIEWFIYAQTAAYVITAVICFFIVAWKSKFSRLRYDHKFFIVILKQSAPFAILALLMGAYTRMDVILLYNVLPDIGKAQAGIYQNGFRIFDAAYQFALLFAVLLLPMFSRMIKERQNIHELTLLSSLLLFIPSIALAVGSQIYRTDIMSLMYDKNINESAAFFGILMMAFLGMAGNIIYGTLLTANGSLREMNITSAIALIINLILNLALIPKFHAFGAAVACLVTQGFVGFSQYVISAQKFNFGLNFKLIFKLIIYITGTILIGIGSSKLDIAWWIGFLGLMAAALILAFLLNLINVRGLVKMVLKGQ
jgi:O-antigen/teichoic acid export membrane protein